MKILYFTATGNSLYIAKSLCGELLSIPQLIKSKTYSIEDDTVGIVFPCFYWGVPEIVENYLKKAEITADYIFAVVSYGSSVGKTFDILNNLVAIDYARSVCMVDNYVPIYDIEEELLKKDQREIDGELSKIKYDTEKKTRNFKSNKLKYYIANTSSYILKNVFSKGDRLTIDAEKCTECKTCIQVCPMDNIKFSEKIEIENRCIFCLACLHACSSYSIHAPREKSKIHYTNPKIKISEIIKSNR